MKIVTVRETVRVVMNLNGGYTKVVTEALGDGTPVFERIEHEVPTALIPEAMRKPSSRFVIVRNVPIASSGDDLASLKKADNIVAIEPSHS